jgi:hypothetical protein
VTITEYINICNNSVGREDVLFIIPGQARRQYDFDLAQRNVTPESCHVSQTSEERYN